MRRIIITGWTNNWPAILFLPILLFINPIFVKCHAQENDNYNFEELNNLFQHHHIEPPKYQSKKDKPKNELEFLLATGFNTYKTFFSSQDNPSCVFHPSCSSFSVQAMQQKGMMIGTLQTFDRLSRCHRFIKTNQYIYDPTKQRFYDPVK